MPLGLLDVLGPSLMVADRIDAETDDLAVPLVELRLQTRHVAELRGTDRCEVLGMGKKDGPPVTDPLVEVDGALRGLGGEVGSLAVDPHGHWGTSVSGRSLMGFRPAGLTSGAPGPGPLIGCDHSLPRVACARGTGGVDLSPTGHRGDGATRALRAGLSGGSLPAEALDHGGEHLDALRPRRMHEAQGQVLDA